MAEPYEKLQRGDGLLLVDVQRDFCAGGRLAVAGADEIVPLLNNWITAATAKNIPVYASRDWHPVRHPSFQEQGGKWPPHCLADSDGARFHAGLRLQEWLAITKGVRFDQDQYSVFDQTGFAVQLRREGVRRLWVGGLALDVCVFASVMDGLQEGFAMQLIRQATRPVNEKDGDESLDRMARAGAIIIDGS
ncbi:MAG: isochorismatase family protein [Desulfurivibrio sp.]|nr:MAG: isochorismatase family protein [Desulfurivibrio sp.]